MCIRSSDKVRKQLKTFENASNSVLNMLVVPRRIPVGVSKFGKGLRKEMEKDTYWS